MNPTHLPDSLVILHNVVPVPKDLHRDWEAFRRLDSYLQALDCIVWNDFLGENQAITTCDHQPEWFTGVNWRGFDSLARNSLYC
jgi:hypothetical protein